MAPFRHCAANRGPAEARHLPAGVLSCRNTNVEERRCRRGCYARLRWPQAFLRRPPCRQEYQVYPTRTVRIVVGFGPGATADFAARAVAQKLSQKFGQQFVVESKPGAGSNIAAEFVARAPKDGYTLLMGTVANTINASISRLRVSTSPRTSRRSHWSPRCRTCWWHILRPASARCAELVALGEGEAQCSWSTAPPASAARCTSMASCSTSSPASRLTHVPYPGSAQSLTDLVGRPDLGDVPAGADGRCRTSSRAR